MNTRLFSVPNLLSFSRLPLAALFVLLSSTTARAIIIALAALTDFADGRWARARRGAVTRFGAALDPITDKVFVLTTLVTYATEAVIAWPQLLVLLARDIYVSVGAAILFVLRLPLEIQARFPGKLVTALQLAAVLVLLLAPAAAGPLVAAVAAASLWAIVDYTRAARAALRPPPQPR